jgi:hypothetical protein
MSVVLGHHGQVPPVVRARPGKLAESRHRFTETDRRGGDWAGCAPHRTSPRPHALMVTTQLGSPPVYICPRARRNGLQVFPMYPIGQKYRIMSR